MANVFAEAKEKETLEAKLAAEAKEAKEAEVAAAKDGDAGDKVAEAKDDRGATQPHVTEVQDDDDDAKGEWITIGGTSTKTQDKARRTIKSRNPNMTGREKMMAEKRERMHIQTASEKRRKEKKRPNNTSTDRTHTRKTRT